MLLLNFRSAPEMMVTEDFSLPAELLLDLSFSLDLDVALDDDFAEAEFWATLEEGGSSLFGATLLLSSPHAESKSTNIKIATTTHSSWQAPIVLVMTFRIKAPQWFDLFYRNIIFPNPLVQKGHLLGALSG